MPLRTRCGTSRLPCMSLGVRAQGLGPRGSGTALAITICSVLPSVPYDAVGPPKFILLSRLNIQPARLPVNASPLLSRTTTHDSGPIWFATPSLGGTCTRETYRFVPAHRLVKKLEDVKELVALLHGPEQIADLPVPVAESPGAVRIGHPERSHLVEYLAPNSVFNSLPRQRSSPHLRPDDRLVTIDRVLHHASLGVA